MFRTQPKLIETEYIPKMDNIKRRNSTNNLNTPIFLRLDPHTRRRATHTQMIFENLSQSFDILYLARRTMHEDRSTNWTKHFVIKTHQPAHNLFAKYPAHIHPHLNMTSHNIIIRKRTLRTSSPRTPPFRQDVTGEPTVGRLKVDKAIHF